MVTRIFLCDERTEPDIRLYIKEAIEDIAQGERYIITWSCSNVQSIKVGDKAYFQRVGFAPEGYFAHGEVVAADREYQLRLKYPRYRDLSEAYDIDFYPNNFRVWVAWDSCTDYDRPLPIDDLRQKSQFRGAFFDAPDSGVVFKEQYVPRLDRAWDRHSLNTARQGKAIRLVDIYYAWAQEDAQQGFNEEALDNYALAIATQPDYIRAYIGRGNLYYGLNEYDNAIADYSAATAIRSKLAKIAFYQRGLTYAKLGQQEKAAADYNEALQIDFEYPEAHFGLANSLFKLKEFEKSVASYTQALNFNPDQIQAYYRRGRCYFVLKQLNKAIADYTEAIVLKPDYADAFYYRAVAYSQPELGQDRQAINDLEKAAQLYREQSRLDRYDRAADLLETIAITAKEKAQQKAQAAQSDLSAPSTSSSKQATDSEMRRSTRPTQPPQSTTTANPAQRVTNAPNTPSAPSTPSRSNRDRSENDENRRTSRTTGINRVDDRPAQPEPRVVPQANAEADLAASVDKIEPEITATAYTPASPEEVWGDESETGEQGEVTATAGSDSQTNVTDRDAFSAQGTDLFSDRLAQMDAKPDRVEPDTAEVQSEVQSEVQLTDAGLAKAINQNVPDSKDSGDSSDPAAQLENQPNPTEAIAMPASGGLETDNESDPEPWSLAQSDADELEDQEQSNEFAWLEQELTVGADNIATPSQAVDEQIEDRSDYLADYLTDGNDAQSTSTAEQTVKGKSDRPITNSYASQTDSAPELAQQNKPSENIANPEPIAAIAPEVTQPDEAIEVTPIEVTKTKPATTPAPAPARRIEFADFADELPIKTGNYDAIERAALVIITSQYIRDGWSVRSVEKSKRGYDLACRKDGIREDVSVRGVAGRNPTFELNSDEIREAEYNDNFVLWVVSSALGNYACQRWSGSEILVDFDLKPMSFVAKPKTE
ncbi:Tetratricopeptide TPR_1 repeat-containing protein [Thalassoporum mexicanum PCC 7367]|uniref:tetratricopeptide repeat protein n=1 Tax=Thalassoporum mexicanum TaxID=3457544 RepID=UPI00029F9DAE|nr:tetratricopeptide repeat protein [Pseudanabaena sp. PCC 7367]AFY69939.1 Tetratricopeptide TPR_1 repeat-containing protein [Pseudanabaena sp. PCC 7367]